MVMFAPRFHANRVSRVRERAPAGYGAVGSDEVATRGSGGGMSGAASADFADPSARASADVLDPSAEASAPTQVAVPDPFADADALEDLGDEIATLAAHIHAATHRMLVLIAEFDRRRGWELGGHATCADWLAARTKVDRHTAREKVRAARALTGLPETSAAMARGELSFSAVRALTRVAKPENEADLVELARGCTADQLDRMVRAMRIGSHQDEAARERERHASRTFSVFPDGEGMYLVKGRLMPEVAAVLMRAVEAASDALYREHRADERQATGHRASGHRDDDTARAAAQRRADAVGLLAERALAAGFGGCGEGANDGNGQTSSGDPTAEAGDVPAGTSPAPISGTRAERYQVVLHVDAATLEREGEIDGEPGRSHLDDGTRVPAGTSRRLACDAAVVRVHHGEDGSILDVGRRTRSIPPALRRALEARDRGCRFPQCGRRFTEGHHVVHWADGGGTSLGNTVLLCRHHHRLVHEGGWQLHWWGNGRPVFFDPRGGTHFDGRWKPPEVEAAAATLLQENRLRGVRPDGRTAGARWERESDIPDAVLFRATEAIVRGSGP